MVLFEDPGTELFEGFNLSTLGVDEAFVSVNSTTRWHVYTRNQECIKCPYTSEAIVESGQAWIWTVDTKFPWKLAFSKEDVGDFLPEANESRAECIVGTDHFGEFGVYSIDPQNCSFETRKEPVNIYSGLLACFLFYVVLAFLWIVFEALWRRSRLKTLCRYIRESMRPETTIDITSSWDADEERKKKKHRLKSLDTFRGFLWIMGVCIPMSIRSGLRRDGSRLSIFRHVLSRSVKLFLLGLILNSLGGRNDLQRFRIFGVLQRFAVAYFINAVLMLAFAKHDYTPIAKGPLKVLQDIWELLPVWVGSICILILHFAFTFFLPVPGCSSGYLGPGGMHEEGAHKKCIGGAAGYIDRVVLGEAHLYPTPTASILYDSGPFDPEGILGSLTSAFQVFLGMQAGMTLLLFSDWKSRVKRWLVWGVTCGALGALLCLASKEQGWIPVNKNLWSFSYVMVTTSMAFFLLTVSYILIDILKWWNGSPFIYPGMNAIVMYAGHSIGYNLFPWHWRYGPMNTHWEMLVESLWGTSLWVIIAFIMYKKKVFVAL
ncbi:unnamed protein product [Darwinula stevensoni]|uniref:Heparan-alpha-glucosaminide N-acetyltransferase n=1 Tax=Darwinula stevensoni TaxID=69355 RepID=A0A7R8ZZR0_9CRUS|nr:unnamed protein product [Darwinula stevensoni]CAG0879332.1 unnamed protein product [Darwinula stevensoni]